MTQSLMFMVAMSGGAPTVPPAPTIGTATTIDSSSATVAFTAPVFNGGSTITSYTATSSPGGFTGTLNQSGSGAITVAGLSPDSSYTFTVHANNSIGAGMNSAPSNGAATPTLTVGSSYGGGYYFGQINDGGVIYNLIAAPRALGETRMMVNGTGGGAAAGTGTTTNGFASSEAMNSSRFPAPQWCRSLNIGGHTDWYLPAKDELEVFFYNFTPVAGGETGSGYNIHAVPPRPYNYPMGSPPKTSAPLFVTGGSEVVNTGTPYWSSTCVSDSRGAYAWSQSFAFGTRGRQAILPASGVNASGLNIRAIRRVAA